MQTEELSKEQEYNKFWTKLVEKFNEEKPGLIRSWKFTNHYLPIPTGTPGIHFEWFLVGYPITEFQVALHFELEDNYYENLRLRNRFKSRKGEFENNFEEELNFDEKNNSTSMFLKKETNSMDDATINWGVKTMITFYDSLKSILDEILDK